jgi:membrane-bound lytic murein transglycosylase A
VVGPSAPPAPAPQQPAAPLGTIDQPRSRWVAAEWSQLPGFADDQIQMAWPALLRGCDKPHPAWTTLCDEARRLGRPDDRQIRQWLTSRLQPYRIEPREPAPASTPAAAGAPSTHGDGLLTAYFEPLVEASRTPRPGFQVPLHQAPPDLATRRPYWTRAELDTVPAARAMLRGREIAYVSDPLDALILQIQGSGRLNLTEADGRKRVVRVAFAGHNDHPYRSIGRWLVDQGAFTLDQASWPAIKAWARANPRRVQEMLHVNPRMVFFREEPLGDPTVGPLGAQGVPLTPGRSIAVDKESVPYGTPVWIDSTEPPLTPGGPARVLQRLVMAQDTGGAIVGAVRADFFWGWGEGADELAGRMKQPLRMWALWPRP